MRFNLPKSKQLTKRKSLQNRVLRSFLTHLTKDQTKPLPILLPDLQFQTSPSLSLSTRPRKGEREKRHDAIEVSEAQQHSNDRPHALSPRRPPLLLGLPRSPLRRRSENLDGSNRVGPGTEPERVHRSRGGVSEVGLGSGLRRVHGKAQSFHGVELVVAARRRYRFEVWRSENGFCERVGQRVELDS